MSESGWLPTPQNFALWAAGAVLGGHLSMGDIYLGLMRALAQANIEDQLTLSLVETLLNQWVQAGVVGAAIALHRWQQWRNSVSS